MKFIPTTAEKLKRLAKTQRNATGTSLAVALDTIAREHGHDHWKHVTECVARTPPVNDVLPPLPDSLAAFLASNAIAAPPSAESRRAFASGLVFAVEVKDADDVRPSTTPRSRRSRQPSATTCRICSSAGWARAPR